MSPYRDDALRGRTEHPREAQQGKVAALYADITRLFSNLALATDPGNHSVEEIRLNRGGLAGEIDKAVDSYAQALKALARM